MTIKPLKWLSKSAFRRSNAPPPASTIASILEEWIRIGRECRSERHQEHQPDELIPPVSPPQELYEDDEDGTTYKTSDPDTLWERWPPRAPSPALTQRPSPVVGEECCVDRTQCWARDERISKSYRARRHRKKFDKARMKRKLEEYWEFGQEM